MGQEQERIEAQRMLREAEAREMMLRHGEELNKLTEYMSMPGRRGLRLAESDVTGLSVEEREQLTKDRRRRSLMKDEDLANAKGQVAQLLQDVESVNRERMDNEQAAKLANLKLKEMEDEHVKKQKEFKALTSMAMLGG